MVLPLLTKLLYKVGTFLGKKKYKTNKFSKDISTNWIKTHFFGPKLLLTLTPVALVKDESSFRCQIA